MLLFFRSIVTLYNRKNHAADFTWSPILSDRGTAFSIRPATGTVEAFKELKCEVSTCGLQYVLLRIWTPKIQCAEILEHILFAAVHFTTNVNFTFVTDVHLRIVSYCELLVVGELQNAFSPNCTYILCVVVY